MKLSELFEGRESREYFDDFTEWKEEALKLDISDEDRAFVKRAKQSSDSITISKGQAIKGHWSSLKNEGWVQKELKEEEFMNTKLDRMIAGMLRKDKVGQSDAVKAKNAYSRGFRGAFAGTGGEHTGISTSTAKYFDQGKKDGAAARKKAGEVLNAFTRNSYGEKKVNQAFEKIVKAAIAPYLEAFNRVEEDLNEANEPDLMMFVKQIAQACGARATSANTKIGERGADLTAKLSDKTKEHLAKAFLKDLGFKEAAMKGTKGSTHGDFSSDIYGSSYEHPSGVTVRVFSNFKFSPATFHIGVHASPEELAKVFGSKGDDLHEGKIKTESAESAFRRYESLKKSDAAPELLAKVLAISTSLMTEKFNAKKREYESKYAGEDWWETVKKMYKIEEQGNKWVVVSNARDWKKTRDWEHATKYEALEHLQKLVMYKDHDRKAGHGDRDKDLERVEKLMNRD